MGKTARVALHRSPNGYAEVEHGATHGAQLGVNLTLNGVVVRPEDILNAYGQSTPAPQFPVTYWRNLLEVPANVTALANTITTGLYVVTDSGASATRQIQEVAGETVVTDGDGVAGDPVIGLADVTATAGGILQKYGFDAKGRRSEEEAATTDDLAEGVSNLYFTGARVLGVVLTGLSVATNAAITAADSVLEAFGKLQAQVTALVASLANYVPTSRTISTTAPLTGGGNLSANRTIAISAATTSAAGSMSGGDKTKLDGIAAGATAGADWSVNLSNIPANIASWSGIAPPTKQDSGFITGTATTVQLHNSTGPSSGGAIVITATPTLSYRINGIQVFAVTSSGNFNPDPDNTRNLGSAGSRWGTVFAATGTINTSDAREKSNIRDLTEQELACASELAGLARIYQWNEALAEKGDAARLHCSPTVQSVIACMQAHGLDPFRYGFVCYDQWDEQPEVRDAETDEVVEPARAAGDRYSLRPSELQAFIQRGQEERLRRIEAALGLTL